VARECLRQGFGRSNSEQKREPWQKLSALHQPQLLLDYAALVGQAPATDRIAARLPVSSKAALIRARCCEIGLKPGKEKTLIIGVRLGYREISGRATEEKTLYQDQRCRAGP
jgi:hypothetical protein